MLMHKSDEEYFAIDAASATALKTIKLKSAAYYKAKVFKESEATILGNAVHMKMLQPEVYKSTYLVVPPDIAKSYSKKAITFADDQMKKPILEKNDVMAQKMVDVIRSRKWFNKLFDGEFEQVALKIIEGVPAKCKFDIVNHERKFVADIKTCQDIGSFIRDFYKYPYGYHIQCSWYSKIMMDDYDFVFIVTEKDPPHDCAIWIPEQDVYDYGVYECRQALDIWKECKATNQWPGYDQKMKKITLPAYLRKEWLK